MKTAIRTAALIGQSNAKILRTPPETLAKPLYVGTRPLQTLRSLAKADQGMCSNGTNGTLSNALPVANPDA
jgi:hypothetical protein